MFLNSARMLNEAMQLAIKGSKVVVSCESPLHGQELARKVITATASVFLLYDHPQYCTHAQTGVGWSVRYKNNNGEIFFSSAEPAESNYFEHFFVFANIWEVRAELAAKGEFQEPPATWVRDTSLVREPVYVPSRYERIMATCRTPI